MFGQNSQNDKQQDQSDIPGAADLGLSGGDASSAVKPEPASSYPEAAGQPAGTAGAQAQTNTAQTASQSNTAQETDTNKDTSSGSQDNDKGLSAPVYKPDQDSASTGSNLDDLLQIKQKALKHLSPLVSHIDQTPEEKFRTTMMMIQASDDQTLIKSAYEAAQKITDDKARAQALLDIVNEINYFSQQKHQN